MWEVNAALRALRGQSMATSATQQAQEKTVNPAVLSTPERRLPQGSVHYRPLAPENKLVGYGLPCSHCHAYYPADMQACPICKCPDRISPTEPVIHSIVATEAKTAPVGHIDDERERLLKELKSQAFAAH